MTNNKAVQIAVQLDVEKLNEGAASLSGLNDIAKQIGDSISDAFGKISDGIEPMVAEMESLTTAITKATDAVGDLMDALSAQGIGDLFFNTLSAAISSISLACDLTKDESVLVFLIALKVKLHPLSPLFPEK